MSQLVAVGTVAFDAIETPFRENRQNTRRSGNLYRLGGESFER